MSKKIEVIDRVASSSSNKGIELESCLQASLNQLGQYFFYNDDKFFIKQYDRVERVARLSQIDKDLILCYLKKDPNPVVFLGQWNGGVIF